VIDLDGDGKADYTSTKALRLDGGSVVYPHNSLLECRDFTVEWFARYETLAKDAMLLRFGMESDTGVGSISWALFAPSGNLQIGANLSSDGSWKSIARDDITFGTRESIGLTDNKWHHWALTAETNPNATSANTTFRLYKDYKQVGNTLVFDKNGGILALPSTGTTLSIGTSGNAINGVIDELRITPSVLEPAKFMSKLPSGLMLFLR